MRGLVRMIKSLKTTSEPGNGAAWAAKSLRLHDQLLLVTQVALIDMKHALISVKSLLQEGVLDAAFPTTSCGDEQLVLRQSTQIAVSTVSRGARVACRIRRGGASALV